MTDLLQKFLFNTGTVRGETVQLRQTWQEIQERHEYPLPVTKILGEMVAASALLCANLKFDGTLVIQLFGQGPIRLLVVECDTELRIRATAKLNTSQNIPSDSNLQSLFNPDGKGRCAIILDPRNRPSGQAPYQGVVPLVGDTLAQVLSHYMHQSEQLETKLWLSADEHTASGLLLQKMPETGGKLTAITQDDDTWHRILQLSHTVSDTELRQLDSPTLLHRLFWQEQIQIFEPRKCQFFCSCSREKVANMLVNLGSEEITSILEEQETVEIVCEFCHAEYRFDAVDCAELFNLQQTPPHSNTSEIHTKH